jgi:hypothetical protein
MMTHFIHTCTLWRSRTHIFWKCIALRHFVARNISDQPVMPFSKLGVLAAGSIRICQFKPHNIRAKTKLCSALICLAGYIPGTCQTLPDDYTLNQIPCILFKNFSGWANECIQASSGWGQEMSVVLLVMYLKNNNNITHFLLLLFFKVVQKLAQKQHHSRYATCTMYQYGAWPARQKITVYWYNIRRFFCKYFSFPLSVSFLQCSIVICSTIIDAV